MPQTSIQQQLMGTIDRDDSNQIRALIAAGADVNYRSNDPDGETLLIRAITANQLSIARLLIELGADVNCAARLNGWTPLMLACQDLITLRELIAAGADVNARTTVQELVSPASGKRIRRGRETALHFAAAANNPEAVKMLIQAGAEIEARDENGLAPLDAALRVGSPTDAAVALVEAGAKITPERLEVMHSGAHPPHSDLRFFPEVGQLASPEVKGESDVLSEAPKLPTGDAKTTVREFKCPKCGALLHSRKARLCGNCGATLVPEVGLSENQMQLMEQKRQWARDLANAFSNPDSCVQSKAKDRSSASENGGVTSSWPARLVRRASSAEEFRNRDRPDFFLYLMGYSFLLAAFVYMVIATGGIPPMAWAVVIGLFVFVCFRAWRRATPICPNCKQNIRLCAPVYCHVCGNLLKGGRCAECKVDHSWSSLITPYAKVGNHKTIGYCPGCGVWLDSKISRWRAGRL